MRGTILAAVLVVAACGGKSSGPTGPSNNGGGAGGGDRLPWESALTVGAKWELVEDLGEEPGAEPSENGPLVVTVTAVKNEGAARVYELSWGGGNGPTSIRVENGAVRIGDVDLASMQEPYEAPGNGWCYGEDFSNPCGCEDVCDASLCFDAEGITSVSGLYAPNYMPYSRR